MKMAWREVMSEKKVGWAFEAKNNGMIFFYSPLTEGRGMLDLSTVIDGVIYNKKGLGVTLLSGKRTNIGVEIADKPGLAEAIQEAKKNQASSKPARNQRALYNWIQSEGYDLDGNNVPCPA